MSKQSNAYIVRTPGGKYGFFYWKNKFVNGECPVNLISDKGAEDAKPTPYNPRSLTIIISMFNGRSRRMIKLPYIKQLKK